ncbi:FAD:protein FMN transferase [Limimaricola hongkongensis]|uniref:FAD:protein FMN transferase n=1 Tax=Limimaricola hongkongensis DSM 17492 TaxID=1122180 RepID=A0A017HER3_9RHOB|nr:FAD:protein FMN transferase [Limimaricola hongkongensis]EYD72805.1 hypothetical protein Lokhon_01610 [Limimaricola hongkongensis DSM 17492]
MRIGRRGFLAGAGAALFASPAWAATMSLGGPAFGSYWRCLVPAGMDRAALMAAATGLIAELTAELSPWQEDSALVALNRAPAGRWIPIGHATRTCLQEAEALHGLTVGGFDARVGPLVARYGFGRIAGGVPRDGRFELKGRAVRKSHDTLTFDPCGLAKGHAVDLLAARIAGLGAREALVEIGGEVRALGRHPSGRAWRLAVERPGEDGPQAQRVIRPGSLVLATSAHVPQGHAGPATTSHVIDPASARPAAQTLLQVSVLAQTGLRADALATGLLALGPERGPALARRAGIAALFLRRGPQGPVEAMTGGFDSRLMT